jgi:hypothetical protein
VRLSDLGRRDGAHIAKSIATFRFCVRDGLAAAVLMSAGGKRMSKALVLSGGGPVGIAWETGMVAGRNGEDETQRS